MNKLGDWQPIVHAEQAKPYYQKLKAFLQDAYATKEIFPKKDDIFNALYHTSLANTKVVILGQDPYHTPGLATGLSFAVPNGSQMPPSLRNMFNEVFGAPGPRDTRTNLLPWAQQGVLLLNTTMTVEKGDPASHFGKGWETFTEALIKAVADKATPVVFLLWGNHAKKYEAIIRPYGGENHHLILKSTHPSPLSANSGPLLDRFAGCRHFDKANAFLVSNNMEPIIWTMTGSE